MIVVPGLISEQYLEQIRELHSRGQRWGSGGFKYAQRVMRLANEVNATSILDYGCGLGTLKNNVTGWPVFEYDPGIVGKDTLPDPADVVVCTDVLEHIEADRIGAVLEHLCSLTNKVCFAVVSTRPANAVLPDGRNAHLLVKGVKWWLAWLETQDWMVRELERSSDQLIVRMDKCK